MTCYTVLQLTSKWQLGLKENYALVSAPAAGIEGTRAELVEGDQMSLHDLLYAMMLPSGNDAATCLAEHFGTLLMKLHSVAGPYDKRGGLAGCKDPLKHFYGEMNENARVLGLGQSYFASPHGLSNKLNKSTAQDIGRLTAHALRLPVFRAVVSCKEYKCFAFTRTGSKRNYYWQNTHKLLWQGYNGVKTGVTPNAGPCLCSSIEQTKRHLIIVLLNSKSMDARWVETNTLAKWAFKALESNKENTAE